MKLLTVIAVVTALVAACDAGSKCVWGPSYWCQSHSTAKECGQENYCQQSVWMVKEKKVGGVIECDMCKLVVGKIEGLVETNSTEVDIEVDVKKLCKYAGPLSGTCESLIDEYFDQIWGMVTKELDAQKVCEMIQLCAPTKTVQLAVTAPKGFGDACSVCNLVVNFIKPFVDNNSTEDKIKTALETFCKLVPGGASAECTDLVDKYFDEIWSLLKTDMDSGDVCKQLGLCNNTLSLPRKTNPKSFGDICSTCKTVVSFLKPFVDSDSDEAMAKSALETFCKILPTNFSSECTSLVDEYFDAIWGILKAEVDSGNVCEQIKLCNTTTLSAPRKPKQVSADLCDLCKLAANFLKTYVDSNSTEQEVKSALEQLCGLLPSGIKDECTSLVDGYFDVIWDLLQKEIDSGDICEQIGLCNNTLSLPRKVTNGGEECEMVISFLDIAVDQNSTEGDVEKALEGFCGLIKSTQCTSLVTEYFNVVWQLVKGELNNDEFCKQTNMCPSFSRVAVSVPKNSVVCDVCKLVVPFLKSFVDNNKTEMEAKAAVETLCGKLPPSVEGECTSLIDNYFGMIWKLLTSYFDDELICSEIDLCTSSSTKLSSPKVSTPEAGVECVICELVMKEVDSLIGNNETEAAIKSALEKVCDLLPSTVKTECDALVDEYADEIIQAILNDTSPDKVCTTIGLCTTSSTKLSSPKVSTPEAGEECVICEYVMKEVDNLLGNNETEAAITSALENVCDILPSTIKTECQEFIDLYTPTIVNALLDNLDPKAVCTALKLCTNSTIRVTTPISVASPKSGPLCVICELVVKELASMLKGNETKDDIEKALDKVCSLIPSSMESKCVKFVDKYTPDIMSLLLNGAVPKTICTLLQMCLFEQQAFVKSPRAVTECEVCKFTIESIKTLIDSKAAEATVDQALEKACSLLPKEISGECEGIVKEYGAPIIQLLDQEIKPLALCEDVKLCKKSNKKAVNFLMKPWLKMARSRKL